MKFTFASGAVLTAVFLPLLASAQTATATDIPTLFQTVIGWINTIVVPLVFAIAFVAFLFYVYYYFIQNAANSEKRKEGNQFLLWSLIGFFVMFSVWGLVNLFLGTLGFNNSSMPGLPTFNANSTSNTLNSGSVFGNGSSYYGSTYSNTTSTGGCPAGYTLSGNQCVGNGTNGTTVGGQYCSDGTTSAAGTACIQCPGIGTTANSQTCATDQQNTGLNSSGGTASNGCPSGYTNTNGQCISNGSAGTTAGGQYCSDGTTSAPGTSCIQCAGIGTTANSQTCSLDQQNVGLNSSGSSTGTTCTDGSVAPVGTACQLCADNKTSANGCSNDGGYASSGNPNSSQSFCTDGSVAPPGGCVSCGNGQTSDNATDCGF